MSINRGTQRNAQQYLLDVSHFCKTQAQFHSLILCHFDEFETFSQRIALDPTTDALVLDDLGVLLKEQSCFLRAVEQNLKKAGVGGNLDLSKLEVCTILNRDVFHNSKYTGAVRSLMAKRETKIALLEKLGPEDWIQRLVEDPLECALSMGKSLAKLSGTVTGVGESENYETGLALIKFNRMVNRKEQVAEVFEPFEVKLDSANDTKITSTRTKAREREKTGEGLRTAIKKLAGEKKCGEKVDESLESHTGSICEQSRTFNQYVTALHQFHMNRKMLVSLQKAVLVLLQATTHFSNEQIRFAKLWHDFLGHNHFDYAYASFREKCKWQKEKAETNETVLTKVEHLLHLYAKFAETVKSQNRDKRREGPESKIVQSLEKLLEATAAMVDFVVAVHLQKHSKWLQTVIGEIQVLRYNRVRHRKNTDIVEEYGVSMHDIARKFPNRTLDPAAADKAPERASVRS